MSELKYNIVMGNYIDVDKCFNRLILLWYNAWTHIFLDNNLKVDEKN